METTVSDEDLFQWTGWLRPDPAARGEASHPPAVTLLGLEAAGREVIERCLRAGLEHWIGGHVARYEQGAPGVGAEAWGMLPLYEAETDHVMRADSLRSLVQTAFGAPPLTVVVLDAACEKCVELADYLLSRTQEHTDFLVLVVLRPDQGLADKTVSRLASLCATLIDIPYKIYRPDASDFDNAFDVVNTLLRSTTDPGRHLIGIEYADVRCAVGDSRYMRMGSVELAGAGTLEVRMDAMRERALAGLDHRERAAIDRYFGILLIDTETDFDMIYAVFDRIEEWLPEPESLGAIAMQLMGEQDALALNHGHGTCRQRGIFMFGASDGAQLACLNFSRSRQERKEDQCPVSDGLARDGV